MCIRDRAWNAPEAYRILFWHVPFAWSSFLAFSVLFIGSVVWYARRSEIGWRLICTGSDLGLLFGLGVVISGPIWGSAEWGVPWDWGDLRLNTYGPVSYTHLTLPTICSVSLRMAKPANSTKNEMNPRIRTVRISGASPASSVSTMIIPGWRS